MLGLDAIIFIGYRVNSLQASRFRQWATRILCDYLVQGYSLNEYRLNQQGLGDLEQALDLLSKTLSQQALVNVFGRLRGECLYVFNFHSAYPAISGVNDRQLYRKNYSL